MDEVVLLIVLLIMSCVFLALGGAVWVFTRPVEGDECKGKDPNAEYEIDDKGKCVFIKCKGGYVDDGNSCVVPKEEEEEVFIYDFIVNVPSSDETISATINEIKLDGVIASEDQIQFVTDPNGEKCFHTTGSSCEDLGIPEGLGIGDTNALTYSSWNKEGGPVKGETLFTVTSPTKVSEIVVTFLKSKHAPGFIIQENGVEKVNETENRGDSEEADPIEIIYEIY
jgi:hypothetical protein